MSVAGSTEQSPKAGLIGKHRVHATDTGSPEVQIALMTDRLNQLAEHFKSHPKDVHSQRGMLLLISRRKQMLQYLKDTSVDRYKKIIGALGLRK